MKNPIVVYAVIGLGILFMIAGLVLKFEAHFRGKAYAVIAVGAVCLIAGIVGMVMKPKTAVAK